MPNERLAHLLKRNDVAWATCGNCQGRIYLGQYADVAWEPDYDPFDDPIVWRHETTGYAACLRDGFAQPNAPVQTFVPRLHIDLARVAELNAERCKLWHTADTEPWSGADWSNAFQGEAGEFGNVVKKLRRIETRTTGHNPEGDGTRDALLAKLDEEAADTLLYLLLTMDHYGRDIVAALLGKFNSVSEELGYPQRLEQMQAVNEDDLGVTYYDSKQS